MMNELSTMLPLLIGVAVFVALCIILVFVRVKRTGAKRLDVQRQQVRSLEKELQKTNKQVLEVRSVMVGLGQKVAEQQDIIQHLIERVTELEHTDSDGRMYSRANKMVQLGAGINELIEECELPKAEAELMMSLQSKIAGKEKVPPLNDHPERKAMRSPAPSRRPQHKMK
ncbi:DUF2802 domain-containing protein [Vibrio tapetis]|uniref:ATPase involved in DNA repair n=1 Tax=Vibrio tapetis subsp. tapetis TaxID=1671868 RepID=A0A2N8ZE95_9VIBR|nr:DUF2802 domain-containing protein [Vibrio tapetis]SON50175.1 conserved protein of unknown function [Vibrio tapetis subsp. tapetis]